MTHTVNWTRLWHPSFHFPSHRVTRDRENSCSSCVENDFLSTASIFIRGKAGENHDTRRNDYWKWKVFGSAIFHLSLHFSLQSLWNIPCNRLPPFLTPELHRRQHPDPESFLIHCLVELSHTRNRRKRWTIRTMDCFSFLPPPSERLPGRKIASALMSVGFR